jgi:hypothetical protein
MRSNNSGTFDLALVPMIRRHHQGRLAGWTLQNSNTMASARRRHQSHLLKAAPRTLCYHVLVEAVAHPAS